MKNMNNPSLMVEDDNLSYAWAKAFLAAFERGVDALSPLVIVIGVRNGIPNADPAVRGTLDTFLKAHGKHKCAETANTIFPRALWNPQADRNRLYERYLRILQRLKKVPANHNGIYFERLITYGRDCNQLEHIISTYRNGNHRGSALVASVFDPSKDHTNQRQRGFPCLHQVAFTPLGNGQLGVTGFYATQYLLDRAYGNYLGLAGLGRFVAHETGLELTRVTCMASSARLGNCTKEEMRPLADRLRALVPKDQPKGQP